MASSGNEQQLRFRWNDHMQHISKVLTLQRFEEQFCDVTLVSDDGFVMKAHQAILASTSNYFQRVFSDITADQHPMVVLRGANFREMSCLLDYMYQGSTQVHQSLMEAVLEVADMLEVKGLSQIRSNNSIKKFMAPPSSNSTSNSTTTASHAHPVDNNSVGLCRSSDEQSGPHTSEDQGYRDSQSRSSDLEGSWMRFSGNTLAETRSKESSSRSISEEAATPSEELPPSSHVPLLPCQETNNPVTQEESQVSGMDLSMAKNEPWSPRESSPSGDKNSPARKRRKLLETICTEETSELTSDPDCGRTGSKVEERSSCHPRTISFTSITSEPGPSTEDLCSIKEDSRRCSNRQGCQHLDIQAPNKHRETGVSNSQSLLNESYICSCRGPCKGIKKAPASKRIDKNPHQIDRNVSKEALKLELLHTGSQSIDSDFHYSNSLMNSCSTKVSSNMPIQELPGIENLCTPKDPHDDAQCITCIRLQPVSDGNALLRQSSCVKNTSSRNTLEEELNESYGEKCNILPTINEHVDKQADADIPQSSSQSKLPDAGLQLDEACSDTDDSIGSCRIYIAEEQESLDKNLKRAEDRPALKPVDAKSGLVDRDPLEIPTSYAESTTASSNEGQGARVTSFVSVNHREHVMVKYSIPGKKGECPLEKRLVRPRSKVKRPLNPYILFQKEMKKKVINDHPGEPYRDTLKRLGIMWKNLTFSEREKWQTEAENLKREHQRQNPNYYYNPQEAFKQRQEYLEARMKRRHLYRVSSESSVEDNPARMKSPKSCRTLK